MAYVNNKETFIIAVKGEKGDPREVKQVTGSSEEAVMSQKAVTDAFDKVGLYYQSYELIRGTMYSGKPTQDGNEPYRFVTPNRIQVKAGTKIEFTPNTTYKYGYAFYDTNGVYDGIDRGWNRESVTLKNNGYICLNFGRVDNAEMDDAEMETIKEICRVINNAIERNFNERLDGMGLIYRPYTLQAGSISNGNPVYSDDIINSRAMTPDHIEVKAGMKILFATNGVHKFGYAFYGTDKVYNGVDYGWNTKTVTLTEDGYIRLNFGRIDNGTMNADDYAAIKEICKVGDFAGIAQAVNAENARMTGGEDIKPSIIIDYGRKNGASYVFARIPKTTNEGNTVIPRLAFTTADGAMNGAKISPLAFAKRENTAFVINAGLFDMTNMIPVGQTIIDGEVFVSAPMEDDNGVPISDTECHPLCIDADGNLSAPYERNVSTDTMLADGVKQSIVGWGRLVNNFEIDEEDIAAEIVHDGDYIRQAIGQFENGDYCVLTADGSRGNVTHEAGMTYTELAEILVEKGVKFAYSLDGGGSAATVIGKRQLNRIYEGAEGRAVPTVIYFTVK